MPQVVKDSLLNMLDRYDSGADPTAIIPLLRETGHCDAAVKVKADLDTTTKYVSLQRHLNTLNDKGQGRCGCGDGAWRLLRSDEPTALEAY